ncbi:hypothetical protein KIN20_005468 [Parelaphostrongylus tenuis]|uniref:Uncharacterized protein n=1 Tax=Parelaphostrongylus tenuis TaxID=148309 RepID=A0AAD5M0E2_PARTN|nr:hypothetical protein KIN20_005468 [Parelaphostrongylus tenuis]
MEAANTKRKKKEGVEREEEREEWRNGGMEEWRNGGMKEWRNGGMEEWRKGGGGMIEATAPRHRCLHLARAPSNSRETGRSSC